MPNRAGQRPAPGVPSPSTTKAQHQPADLAAVAFRLHALGGTERAAVALIGVLTTKGVRNLRAYVAGISDDDLTAYLDRLDCECDKRAEDARKHADRIGYGSRRGDLMSLRSLPRWPWRTSSGQSLGGGRNA